MIQSSMLAAFAGIPPEKLPKVVDGLNAQVIKLGSSAKVNFMLAIQDDVPVIRAQIVTKDFSTAEKMSDTVETLLTKLGGVVGERVMAGDGW